MATLPYRVEVWCESDSIAGTLVDIAHRWRVPLYPIKGQSSETFAYNAAQLWLDQPWRRPVVLYIGDHDPAGLEIEESLHAKLLGFADSLHHEPEFSRLGVTWQQAVLTAPELRLLEQVCATADAVAALEAVIAEEGQTATGSTGQTVVHPAVSECRQQRIAFGRLLGQMALPDPEGSTVRTPAQIRAQRAGQARWRAQRRQEAS